MTNPIPVHKARKYLGEIIDVAYYTGRPSSISKGKKTRAVIVGLKEFSRMLELIEKHDPGLADTLAIISNQDIQTILSEDEKNIKQGKLIYVT